jgi:hypothetical protein
LHNSRLAFWRHPLRHCGGNSFDRQADHQIRIGGADDCGLDRRAKERGRVWMLSGSFGGKDGQADDPLIGMTAAGSLPLTRCYPH